MPNSGKFITLEGVDGSGKTVQANLLSEFLSKNGIKNIHIREPGGTPLGEKIRSEILVNQDIDPLTSVFMFFAARNELLRKVITPALTEGTWVICDRFYDSTLVYQGILEGVDVEGIMQIKDITMGAFEPDLTLVFNIPPSVALERVRFRASDNTKYDSMDLAKYEQITEGYKKICEIFRFRCAILKSNKDAQKVFEEVKNLLQERFPSSLQAVC